MITHLFFLALACSGSKDAADTGTSDTDADTDADSDADTDADADTDSDADTDTAAETAATGDTGPSATGDTGAPPWKLPSCPANPPLDDVLVFDPVKSVQIVNDELVVSLGYSCGCYPHVTDACFDASAFGKGPNPTLDVLVTHDSNNDPCQAFCYDEVRLGLQGVQQQYQTTYGAKTGTVDLVVEWPSPGGPQSHTISYTW